MNHLKDVKVLIWDFDGTFYKPIPELWDDIRNAEYQTIVDYNRWPLEKAQFEFNKLHKNKIASATETVAYLCKIPTNIAAIHMEERYDRLKYLKHDRELVNLFVRLAKFRHYILANGVKAKITQSLEKLGLNSSIFSEIITSEIIGANKPDPKGFEYIIAKTGLPPTAHLMVGDRENIDLAPAKALGMQTCLVWSDAPGELADATLTRVYGIADLLV